MVEGVLADYKSHLTELETHWRDKLDANDKHQQGLLTEMATKHAAEMEATRRLFDADVTQRAAAAAAARDRLEAQHSQQVATLNDKLNDEIEFGGRELQRQLGELREKKDAEMRVGVAAIVDKHQIAIAALNNTVEACNRAIGMQAQGLKALEGEKETLLRTIAEKRAELIQKELVWQTDKEQCLETQRKHHKVEVEQLVEVHLHETQALNSQFEKTRQLLQEQQQQLIGKIREWEQVYARRDSRLEDLNRIADLEQDVAEKDALVQQTVDEMAYIKRELLNREETYNKTFGRSPNVGVLQVLKPTALNTGAPVPPKLRKTKLPPGATANVANQARPLPPIGATNQQSSSYRDLGQS
ncbi:Aste57867_10508 [Aphanomyces stellatus]|uniref:Aste57867_10508 protein n=1 Tax=Aphanomyces stellatus TaxID=120398 RepID=A0A485KR22_9STRA|nr:hypothetical protein As57867_010468 [Aphanomyces stellatus]VFT87381.1 Aste57867_10508 [Aphanomyces stellatus]